MRDDRRFSRAAERLAIFPIGVALLLTVGCTQPTPPAPAAGSKAVTIMAFNVENLFDNEDDPGKDDRTYLPIAKKRSQSHREACAELEVDRWRDQCLNWDWSDQIVDRKLSVIAEVILQVNDGSGPDVIALQEVENADILNRLREEYLPDAGYLPAILIEGNDRRGIDVAFLSRLPLAGAPRLHDIVFSGADPDRVADTRGILQADFVLPDGRLLTGYSVHFPAPYHPTRMRVAAYETLNRLRRNLPNDRAAFAAGDFNTTTSEDQRESMLDRFARPLWQVTHDEGCDLCLGTNYYAPNDSWSFLDMVLWSPAVDPGEASPWRVRPGSVAIANRISRQVTAAGTPARFSLPEGNGVSDHWPVIVTIESQ